MSIIARGKASIATEVFVIQMFSLLRYIVLPTTSKILYISCQLIKSASDKFYCDIRLVLWIIFGFHY
jgi:hypothetical protein